MVSAVTSLATGVAAGFVMHRSDFCLAGMLRDLFLFRRTFMLRMFALMLLVTMLLVEIGRLTGLVRMFPFPGFGMPGAATVIGGMLFGVGMVLAGGCVVGTLYRMGAGSVLSAVAFAGLIVGSVFYAEFHPVWKNFADATLFFRGPVTLSQLTGVSHSLLVLCCAAVLLTVLIMWGRRGELVRRSTAEGYLQPWKASLVLAGLTFWSVSVIGVPMGITTTYSKIGAWLESLIAPGHTAGLGYLKAIAFDYQNTLLGISYRGGPGPALDGVSLMQYPLVAGIIAGGMASAILIREFRPHWNVPASQYVSALAGGILMGLAARMAPACNVWHLMGGLPIMALQSMAFVAGVVPGAWLGGRLLTHILSFNQSR